VKLLDNLGGSYVNAVMEKVMTLKTLTRWAALAIIIQGVVACGGNESQNETVPQQGTYKVLKSSTIPVGVREFHAQDLMAAREESTGTLKLAYEGALSQFAGKYGRAPQDDLETAAAICDWVASHLRHPHFYPEDPFLPRFYKHLTPDLQYNSFYWDPAKTISYTLQFDPSDAENWPSPLCTSQNFAAAGIMNYAGLHARLCYVEGHDGLEYYSWKYKKWIWCDSTFNEHFLLTFSDGTFLPLGAKELQELTLYNGLQKVQTVKHGYPDETIASYSYLGAHPHGFRRYGPFLYMQTLNGMGRYVSSTYMGTSGLPVPETYIPAANEIVQLELDIPGLFSRLPFHTDPLQLDVPLNAITIGDTVSPQPDVLIINLRTWLPHAARFEVQYGAETPWQTLELISTPSATGRTSSIIRLPWNSGIVSFRAKDKVGNTSETLTILLN